MSVSVVASGLDNPRGLSFGPNGALFVAEAGRGGTAPCFEGPEGGEVCFGLSGAITRVWQGTQERVISGLPSIAAPDGSGAVGPVDVSLQGNGNLYAVIGLGADPALRPALGEAGADMGKLIRINQAKGSYRVVADIAGFEAANDPDAGMPGTHVDSNPYSVLALPGGQVVADAGGNTLLKVNANGRMSLLAVFAVTLVEPDFPMQPVPTSVVLGPDGAYYVGQLTGFPFPVGGAKVFRVIEGQAPEVYAEGFTNIIDLAFAPDGTLYVLEIDHNSLLNDPPFGALIRVGAGGGKEVLLSDGELLMPGGLAVGPDGALYISNCGVCAGGGEVLRVVP